MPDLSAQLECCPIPLQNTNTQTTHLMSVSLPIELKLWLSPPTQGNQAKFTQSRYLTDCFINQGVRCTPTQLHLARWTLAQGQRASSISMRTSASPSLGSGWVLKVVGERNRSNLEIISYERERTEASIWQMESSSFNVVLWNYPCYGVGNSPNAGQSLQLADAVGHHGVIETELQRLRYKIGFSVRPPS